MAGNPHSGGKSKDTSVSRLVGARHAGDPVSAIARVAGSNGAPTTGTAGVS